jgi:hypothetical protein
MGHPAFVRDGRAYEVEFVGGLLLGVVENDACRVALS